MVRDHQPEVYKDVKQTSDGHWGGACGRDLPIGAVSAQRSVETSEANISRMLERKSVRKLSSLPTVTKYELGSQGGAMFLIKIGDIRMGSQTASLRRESFILEHRISRECWGEFSFGSFLHSSL